MESIRPDSHWHIPDRDRYPDVWSVQRWRQLLDHITQHRSTGEVLNHKKQLRWRQAMELNRSMATRLILALSLLSLWKASDLTDLLTNW